MSSKAKVELCGVCMFLILLTKSMVLVREVWLWKVMCRLINLSTCLLSLCDGAGAWLISGRMGIPILCIFGRALSMGAWGLICFRYVCWFWGTVCGQVLMISLICLWYLIVGSSFN